MKPHNMSKTVEKIAMGAKPDPYNYTIKSKELVNGNTIILANYGGQTFNGDKLMLLRGDFMEYEFDSLDPHFLDEDYVVVARFIPTEIGWNMARMCATSLN